jgi:hypothetical protein
LLFRSEEAIGDWCQTHAMPVGATLTVAKTWTLAQRWYHNRLAKDYHGRSIAEAEAIFACLGLSGPFWQFASSES